MVAFWQAENSKRSIWSSFITSQQVKVSHSSFWFSALWRDHFSKVTWGWFWAPCIYRPPSFCCLQWPPATAQHLIECFPVGHFLQELHTLTSSLFWHEISKQFFMKFHDISTIPLILIILCLCFVLAGVGLRCWVTTKTLFSKSIQKQVNFMVFIGLSFHNNQSEWETTKQ